MSIATRRDFLKTLGAAAAGSRRRNFSPIGNLSVKARFIRFP